MKIEDFQMKVTGQYRSSLSRQIAEGIFISKKIQDRNKTRDGRTVLNSQKQFFQPGIIRPSPSQIEYERTKLRK